MIEARKLIGGQLNAIVKVVCGGDINETATKKGSNNPYWDQVRGGRGGERRGGEGRGGRGGERRGGSLSSVASLQMLYFNFKDRPQAVFDKVLEIKVLNAKVVLKDALIGSFKVSVHFKSWECVYEYLLPSPLPPPPPPPSVGCWYCI